MAGAAPALGGADSTHVLKRENARLQALVFELRTASPSVARLTDLAVWREREAFEEKTDRALVLLRKKDAKIRELGEALAKRNASIGRQRAANEKSSAAAAAAAPAGARDVGVYGGRRGDGGSRSVSRNGTAADGGAVVVARLEKCVEEQADQIEALLDEVARLRSAGPDNDKSMSSSACSERFGRDRDALQNARSGRGYTSTHVAHPSPARTICNTNESPEAQEAPANGKEWRAPAQAMSDPNCHVPRLESALSAQGVALAQNDEALQASAKYREREARLAEKVETLERLQETARRTVLDREERLRAAEAALAEGAAAASTSPSSSSADAARAAAAAAAAAAAVAPETAAGVSAEPADAADVLNRGNALEGPPAGLIFGHGPAALEGRAEEDFAAQEWWLRLAAAEKRREERGRELTREAADGAAPRGGGGGGGKEARRLHRLLEEQGLEVVALRQRVLKAEIAARARLEERDENRRVVEEVKNRSGRKAVTATSAAAVGVEGPSTTPHELAGRDVNLGGMEEKVAALHAHGDTREALIVAREAFSELKLRLIKAEGEIELHAQLLEDEKRRSAAALSRAEDLQGQMDRVAVKETLRGVAGGTVSASALIDRFAGTLFKQSRRVKGLEAEVRNMRTRCARLARLARGDPADTRTASAAPVDGASNAAGSSRERADGRVEDECWIEARVQEAAAAMEAGRRRALEEEIESLKNEVLTERRRADTARRDAADERRLRSLAAAAANGGSAQHDISHSNNTVDDAPAAQRRQLKLASREIEALRTHNKDLRGQIQSGWWSWLPSSSSPESVTDHGGVVAGDGGGEDRGVSGGAFEAYAAADAALREIGIGGGGGDSGGNGSGDDSSALIEVDRLTSLLAERDAQVGVLTSTIEALRISPTFVHTDGGGGVTVASTGGSGAKEGGDTAMRQPTSPRPRASRDTTRTATTKASEGSPWAGAGWEATDGGGGVGALNRVGAQGLARRCVSLTVRLAAAITRAGKAERRGDRLAAETQRRDKKIIAAVAAEAALVRRNRALENGSRKTAAALGALRAESNARLREAGEEASKLRSALRDAELGTDDACRRLASARAEAHGLAVEIQSSRDNHREEIARLSEGHDVRIKECADRLSLDDASSIPQRLLSGGLALRGPKRGGGVAGGGGAAVTASFGARPSSFSASPVSAAIAEISAQWRAFVSQEVDHNDDAHRDRHRHSRRQRLSTPRSGETRDAERGAGRRSRSRSRRRDGGAITVSERQLAATTAFLQEAATRLDIECNSAVRRARTLEWELAGARRGELDAKTALEEAREEVCRLSARTAVAEAAVTAAAQQPPAGSSYPAAPHADHLAGSSTSYYAAPGGGGGGGSGIIFGFDGNTGSRFGTSGGDGQALTDTGRSHYTIAAVSLLEKRFAAAVEDLLASGAARAAALAGEATANARAEEAEATAKGAVASADLLAAELERHKTSASDEAAAAAAAEWRRKIREELGRWWRDDLLPLHDGVTLDWGSAGAADRTAAAWASTTRKSTSEPLAEAAAAELLHPRNDLGVANNGRYFSNSVGGGGDGHRGTADARGVTGEEAMAQALIAGRAEQAFLEDRLRVSERCAEQFRRETLRLHAVLERWHGDFVAPALQQKTERNNIPLPGGPSAASEPPQKGHTAGPTELSVVIESNGALERKLLAATAGLLGAREEVAGLRREVASLRALVSRLREDENDARETAGRRVECARETARRRAEGDLRDLTDRLEEERERFKSQLGAAHAEILRLRAEASRLEKRRTYHHREMNETMPRRAGTGDGGGDGGSGNNGLSMERGGGVDGHARKDAAGESLSGRTGGARKRRAAAEEEGDEDSGGVVGGVDGEQVLRREVEEEREALRRMCNGLAVDLKEAVDATSEAKEEREALVQEAAKARAEAQMAGLARENLEVAVKELGRLLESARRAIGGTKDATAGGRETDQDRPLHPVNLSSGWDRSNEEGRRFAKVMVSAKVAEADLLRRLQRAASSESDLRHMLRRRDIRIEELKRDQATSDRLGTSFGGSGSGSSIPYHRLPFSLRESGSLSAISGPAAAAATTKGSKAVTAGAAERAAKEVGLTANVRRLELELAEATARGEVGDSATRVAERLAWRLFPEAAEPAMMAGGNDRLGGGSGRAICHVCRTNLERAMGSSTLREPEREFSGRGALFLVPSADVERKSARAAATTAAKSPKAAMTMENASAPEGLTTSKASTMMPATVVENSTACADENICAAEAKSTSPARSSMRTRSPPSTSARVAGRATGRGGRPASSPLVTSIGLSDGVRSLEAHLARLEAGVARGDPVGITESKDEGESAESGLIGSATSPGGGEAGGDRQGGMHRERGRQNLTFEVAWADALRDLRTQVAGLRHRAEVTEEMLEDERAGKDDLEEEALRLRTELLKQQRTYWQATATLKERYERALREDEEENREEDVVPAPIDVAAVCSVEAVASRAAQKGSPYNQGNEEVAAQAGKAISSASETGTNKEDIQQQQQHGPFSGGCLDEQLRATRQELREVRSLHDREAKEVAAELTRVVEAHRARVATLEEKLRRTRRKMGAMARPKPTAGKRESAAKGGGRARGGDGSGDFAGILHSSTPLSADELLNLLTTADEEAFEAKGRAQRLEYELHAKTAELNALLLLREPGTGATLIDDHTAQAGAERAGGGGASTAADAGIAALSPSYSAAAAAVNAAGSAKAGTGLASAACYARLAFAEAEVENLRDRNEASRELVIEAQREASALRLAAHRKTTGRADESRSREKELRRQVSAYRREAERLRSAAGTTGPASATGKNGRAGRGGGGGAAAGEAEAEAALFKKRAQQLAAAREESERRGRTIVSLRAAKTDLGEEVQRLRQEATDQGEKLARALKDLGVKGNTVNALREKVAVLEAEIVVHTTAKVTGSAVGQALSVVATADNGRGADAGATAGGAGGAAVATTTPGSGDAAGIEPAAPPCDVNTATIGELRAERDRLRANMRGWRGSLSKKSAAISAQVTEIERLEGEAGALRAAVARKEDAYRAVKKQLIFVREEYEHFKEFSHRWRADAEVKWRGLKRASEAARRRAEDSERSGDVAELELAALKSAFRSFLKTLWDDLRSRPVPTLPPSVGAGLEVGPLPGIAPAISGGCRDVGSGSGSGTAQSGVRPRRVNGRGSAFDGESSGLSSRSGVSWMEESSESAAAAAVPSAGEEIFTGLAKATAAMAAAAAAAEAGVKNGVAASAGGGGKSPFAELTEAEVSDMMQALSGGEGDGGSCLLSISSSFSAQPYVEEIGEGTSTTISSSYPQQQRDLGSKGGQRGAMPEATQRPLSDWNPGVEKESFLSDIKNFLEQEPPFVDHHSAGFEGKEAFADRVELALGGSNPSAALAVMLRSMRTSGISKAAADGSSGRKVPPLAPPPREETKLSRSWSQPGPSAAGFSSNIQEKNAVERWPPLGDRVPAPAKAAGLESHRSGDLTGKIMPSPLEEVLPACSASDTAALGDFGSDPFRELSVEDLASSS